MEDKTSWCPRTHLVLDHIWHHAGHACPCNLLKLQNIRLIFFPCAELNRPVRWSWCCQDDVCGHKVNLEGLVNDDAGATECCVPQHGETWSMRWIRSCIQLDLLVWGVGGLRVLYYYGSASRVALIFLVHSLLSVQMRHEWKGDVQNCVPVKLNGSIILVFYQ